MSNPWFPFGTAPAALGRVFCVPFAGAGASAYATWVKRAPQGVSIVPVQLPGREQRRKEPPEPNLRRLVDALVREIAPMTSEPYSLFGHNMGALVVFELARALRRLGAPPPVTLFVSGRGAPDRPVAKRQIHMLPDREFIQEIRKLRGTPDALLDHPDFTSAFLPALRADFALIETYKCAHEAPLDTPISVFGGEDDQTTPADALEGWRVHTTARFLRRTVRGGHFVVTGARAEILDAIAADLTRP